VAQAIRTPFLGMTQTDLGNLLGMTHQQIQKYATGINAVAWSRIPGLCKALDMKPSDLFGSC
jgi:DNA-binding Xre family transcriptional regulator